MTSKKLPVPEENRTPKGPGSDPPAGTSDMPDEPEKENFDQQGRTANTKRNTIVQGNYGKRQRT